MKTIIILALVACAFGYTVRRSLANTTTNTTVPVYSAPWGYPTTGYPYAYPQYPQYQAYPQWTAPITEYVSAPTVRSAPVTEYYTAAPTVRAAAPVYTAPVTEYVTAPTVRSAPVYSNKTVPTNWTVPTWTAPVYSAPTW